MKAVLTRLDGTGGATTGRLKVMGVGHPTLYTLEEPWINNARNISCIPEGQYICRPHNWDGDRRFRFSRVWQICAVPNRTGILIHASNTVRDISGCVAVGLSEGKIGQLKAVLESKRAIDLLRSIIGEREFLLEVTSKQKD